MFRKNARNAGAERFGRGDAEVFRIRRKHEKGRGRQKSRLFLSADKAGPKNIAFAAKFASFLPQTFDIFRVTISRDYQQRFGNLAANLLEGREQKFDSFLRVKAR